MKTGLGKAIAAIVGLVMMGSVFEVSAGWRDYLPTAGDDSPDVLLVTANFAKSRLLAEVVQMETSNPILLISAEAEGDQIFYMPEYPDARLIPAEQLIDFLALISPEKIIVLGDETYVSETYVKLIRNRYPMMLVSGDDWVKNAKAVADAVKEPGLEDTYRAYLGQLLEDQIKRAEPGEPVNMDDRLIVP